MADAPESSLPPPRAVVFARSRPGASPNERLAGLSLGLRTVLTLQKEGIERIWIVVDPDDRQLPQSIRGDRRVKVPCEFVQAATAHEALDSLGDPIEAPTLLAFHDVIVNPAIYRALLEAAAASGATGTYAAARGTERLRPMLVVGASKAFDDTTPILVDVGDAFHVEVDTEEGKRRAVYELFEACRKKVDGVVSRNLNRHISIFISKRIINTPLTPNMMSVFTFLLAVAAAILAAKGGYANWLAAAFLLQWNSILDGVDGELARVRFQHSKLGQWLDTVSDDVSNWMFYIGMSIGVAQLPYGNWLAICAWVGVVTHMLATVQYYAEMIKVGSGDLYAIDWDFDKTPPTGFWGRMLVFWRNALKRDAALLFFLGMAVVGALPYILPIVAGGSIGTFIAATKRNLTRRRNVPAEP